MQKADYNEYKVDIISIDLLLYMHRILCRGSQLLDDFWSASLTYAMRVTTHYSPPERNNLSE